MSKIVVGEIEGPSTTSNKITIATGSQLDLVGSTGTTTIDAADITAGSIPNARLAAGTIVQVIQTVKTDTFETNALASTEKALTGLTASITPTLSTSKILITVSLCYGCTSTHYKLRVKRDSTLIGQGDADEIRQQGIAGLGFAHDNNQVDTMAFSYLDSPGTVSAITYSLHCITDNTNTLCINFSPTDANSATGSRVSSTLTLMEIKA